MTIHAMRCRALESTSARYVLAMMRRIKEARFDKPIAVAGDWIICDKAHRICRVAFDIFGGTILKRHHLDEWRDGMGPSISFVHWRRQPCVVCGSLWLNPRNGRLHIEGKGWV